jgi:hypothetical protein
MTTDAQLGSRQGPALYRHYVCELPYSDKGDGIRFPNTPCAPALIRHKRHDSLSHPLGISANAFRKQEAAGFNTRAVMHRRRPLQCDYNSPVKITLGAGV